MGDIAPAPPTTAPVPAPVTAPVTATVTAAKRAAVLAFAQLVVRAMAAEAPELLTCEQASQDAASVDTRA